MERLEAKVNAEQEVKKACYEVTKACLEDRCWSKGDEGLLKRGGACLEKREANLKEMETVLELQEVPKDESIVEAIRTLEDRCGTDI